MPNTSVTYSLVLKVPAVLLPLLTAAELIFKHFRGLANIHLFRGKATSITEGHLGEDIIGVFKCESHSLAALVITREKEIAL